MDQITVAEIMPAVIACIAALIPVGGLVWNASKMHAAIKQNAEAISKLELTVNSQHKEDDGIREELNARLAAIESTLAKIQGYLEARQHNERQGDK